MLSREPSKPVTHGLTKEVFVDCDRGRALGCASFCCSLIVRLRDGEVDPGQPHNTKKHCLDKDPVSGRCVYQHPDTRRCTQWARRPAACREYDCNIDPKLKIVLRDGFTSLMALVRSEINESLQHRAAPEAPRSE
jgi:Fe-S-cluster containining protein